MKAIRQFSALIFAFAATAFPAAGAAAADDFYRGKTIRIIVGNAPGGGFDFYARAVARFLPKYIPGEPAFVVENMPGAGSLRALQYLAVNAPRDGTAIGPLNANLINLSVLEPKTTEAVDFDKLNWLGSLASATKVCFAWHESGITRLEDLKSKQLILGGTAKGSGDVYGALLKAIYGDSVKLVVGYASNNHVWLAFEKGELNGNCTGWNGLPRRKPDWIRDGKINYLVQVAKQPLPTLPNVPLIYDLPLSDDLRRAIEFLTIADAIIRPFTAPPGVPREQLQILRNAFAKMAADPEFQQYMEKEELEVTYVNPEEVAKIVATIRNTPTSSVEVARELSK